MPEGLRLGFAVAMLAGAAILDLRARRVPNPYWFPFVALAGFLWLGEAVAGTAASELAWQAGAALVTCGLLYALWMGGAFGGADAKGLMVLAWLWPARPDLLAGRITPAVDAFVAATFLMVAVPVVYLAWNLGLLVTGRGPLRLPAALLGVEVPLARAQERHVWPLQAAGDDGRLRWVYWHRPGGSLDETYRRLRRAGVQRVWVTPKVPFMVPLLAGLFVTRWVGNLALWLAQRL